MGMLFPGIVSSSLDLLSRVKLRVRIPFLYGFSETKQTEVCQIKEDDIDEPDSEAVKVIVELSLF